jgi:hypothetical protein
LKQPFHDLRIINQEPEIQRNFIAMLRHIIFLLATFLSIPAFLAAQDDERTSPKTRPPYVLSDHLVYGGNVSLNFGNVTSIGVSPMIGYKLTDKFIPGIGFTYNYLRFHYQGYQSEAIHIYGGSIWARYYLFENVFLHGEYESLNGEWDPYGRPGYRYYLNSALVGGGYRQGSDGLSTYILVLYNVTFNESSPYDSPWVIRVGLGFGL